MTRASVTSFRLAAIGFAGTGAKIEERCSGMSPSVTSGFSPTKDPQAEQSVVDCLGERSWFKLEFVCTVLMLWVSVS